MGIGSKNPLSSEKICIFLAEILAYIKKNSTFAASLTFRLEALDFFIIK